MRQERATLDAKFAGMIVLPRFLTARPGGDRHGQAFFREKKNGGTIVRSNSEAA